MPPACRRRPPLPRSRRPGARARWAMAVPPRPPLQPRPPRRLQRSRRHPSLRPSQDPPHRPHRRLPPMAPPRLPPRSQRRLRRSPDSARAAPIHSDMPQAGAGGPASSRPPRRRPSLRQSCRRAGAPHARLAHRRARACRQRPRRTPPRGDRLPGLAPPAGWTGQSASAPPSPRPAPAGDLRRDDRPDRYDRDGGDRPRARQLGLDGQGRRRVPRRARARR